MNDNKSISTVVNEGPESINVKFKVGVLELNDLTQTIKMDVKCFFYFQPARYIVSDGNKHTRFETIVTPDWVPHFDFANQFDERILIDELYWLDNLTGLVFGRQNLIISIQENFDHHLFPFDRHIVDVQAILNNCLVQQWVIENPEHFPPELALGKANWLVQAELNAVGDAWDLEHLEVYVVNDDNHRSSIVHVQIFVEREPKYYFWTIIVIYFVIVLLKCVLIAFPYTEARFEYSMTLALTSVAFMFVTKTMVPATSYLTQIDEFMLFGLFLIFLRFMVDLAIQLKMEEFLPFKEEALRTWCDEENENSYGFTPCDVDMVSTAALGGLWFIYFLYFLICTFWFRKFARTTWKKIDKTKGEVAYQEKEVVGTDVWNLEERAIGAADLREAINKSSRETAAMRSRQTRAKLQEEIIRDADEIEIHTQPDTEML